MKYDKAKAEELAKKQRQIQEEKEKEKIKREQEKAEKARKEQERAKLRIEKELREKELREKEQQKLRDLKNSAQRENSRPNTPSYNLKNNENVKYVSNPKLIKLESPRLASPSIQLKSPKPRLQSPSPRLKSPSPKLPNIKQRPMSSRNQDNVKGFNIQDQVNNHFSNNSNGIPKYENNVYDCRPSSKLAAQKD